MLVHQLFTKTNTFGKARIMKKSTITILILIAAVALSYSFVADTPSFQNLKILPKSIDKYQLDSVMKQYAYSLGVNCDFCHVQTNNAMRDWDFASDENANKLVARDMMKMTSALNQTYFDVKPDTTFKTKLVVTCYSCHHGKEHPATIAPKPAIIENSKTRN